MHPLYFVPKRVWDEWVFPSENKRLLVVTTFFSFIIVLLGTLLFFISNINNSLLFHYLETSKSLDAYVSKNDIVNEFAIRGMGISPFLLQQWAYYFTSLRQGYPASKEDYEWVRTAADHDNLMYTIPNLVDIKNAERQLLTQMIQNLQFFENILFVMSFLIQIKNAINIFKLTRQTLKAS